MEKQIPAAPEIFELLAAKYGSGERRSRQIDSYRTPCDLVTIKLFADKNGAEKNKALLLLNQDEAGYLIALLASDPKNGKGIKSLFEIRPSKKSGEPNVSFGEQSCGISRVLRFRSDHDEFGFRARELAFDILKDINQLFLNQIKKQTVEA